MNFLNSEIKAYAKINLHLEILNKRDDGYHNLFGLFAKINIFDLLKLEYTDIRDGNAEQINVEINARGGLFKNLLNQIPLYDNLVYKATQHYFKGLNKTGTIVYSLTKNIPAGGGLGGGSTDCAAALKVLNNTFGYKTSDELIQIGAKLGADIPFCLHNGFAICEGIGEKVQPLKGKMDYALLVLNNGTHIDTKQAYKLLGRNLNQTYNNTLNEKKTKIINAILTGNISEIKDLLVNDFEKKIFDLYPEISIIKRKTEDSGADFSIMTGSGSTIVGLFKNKLYAHNAYNLLKNEIKYVFLTDFADE